MNRRQFRRREYDEECAGCNSGGEGVVPRQVGSNHLMLCRDCADARRAASPQVIATQPPSGLPSARAAADGGEKSLQERWDEATAGDYGPPGGESA